MSLFCAPSLAEEQVPASLIRLPESVKSLFVADTKTSRFHHFENDPAQGVRHRGDTYMSIGENGDDKQRSGDRKTPLGIYFVTEQLETSRMHEKYGHTAFTLDYPNVLDRRMRRTGDGIWIHGVDSRGGQRPRLNTDGCIALENEALAELEGLFEPNVTPVIITRNLAWATPEQVAELRRDLDEAIGLWVESRQQGDLYTYLSLYDEDFRHWGMNKREWIAFQTETLPSRRLQSITVTDLLHLADPVEEHTYLSRFRMRSRESEKSVNVTKRLYWRKAKDGAFRLIAEDSG
ncbi:MAG: L,D-transpeptidase family protein [Woeseiaceae bacterium]